MSPSFVGVGQDGRAELLVDEDAGAFLGDAVGQRRP